MEILQYKVPVANEKLMGKDSAGKNYWAVMGYLKGLEDVGVTGKVELEFNTGSKGAQFFEIEISLEDITKRNIIDETLREIYKAEQI